MLSCIYYHLIMINNPQWMQAVRQDSDTASKKSCCAICTHACGTPQMAATIGGNCCIFMSGQFLLLLSSFSAASTPGAPRHFWGSAGNQSSETLHALLRSVPNQSSLLFSVETLHALLTWATKLLCATTEMRNLAPCVCVCVHVCMCRYVCLCMYMCMCMCLCLCAKRRRTKSNGLIMNIQ